MMTMPAARPSRSALATPIQIGENFIGVHAMESALAANSADLMMPDLCRIGGVTGWQQAATLAAGKGIKLSSHLFPEVSSHLLAVTPTQHWLEYVDWAAPILAEPLQVTDGARHALESSGNGNQLEPGRSKAVLGSLI